MGAPWPPKTLEIVKTTPQNGFFLNKGICECNTLFYVHKELVVGLKAPPNWGIKPPPTPVLAIFDPWGGFMPPGGGFIPPLGHGGAGLLPLWGGFVPAFR